MAAKKKAAKKAVKKTVKKVAKKKVAKKKKKQSFNIVKIPDFSGHVLRLGKNNQGQNLYQR